MELGAAVNALAERRRVAEDEVAAQIADARTSLEQERNRLATLMAELAVAVVVCNVDGRILLYNSAARAVLDDEAAVGIGRSVFGMVDRDLLQHALARIEASATSSHLATTLHRGRVLQVRVAPVSGPDHEWTGFMLLLEDLTERMGASARRNDLLQEFTESTRASLGSIRAAIETVVGYPEMDATERQQFISIVRDESQRLGGQVEEWACGISRVRGGLAVQRHQCRRPRVGGRRRGRASGGGDRFDETVRRVALGARGQPRARAVRRTPRRAAGRDGRGRGGDSGRRADRWLRAAAGRVDGQNGRARRTSRPGSTNR